MFNFVHRIAAWITAGYPEAAPGPERVPLLALFRRRLTDDDVTAVATALLDAGEFDDADIGAQIISITDELPWRRDIERVRARLATNER